MSLLSINLGIELGYDDEALLHLGSAALLHDIGLYRLPSHFRDPTNALCSAERWDYRRHPLMSQNEINRLAAVPEPVAVIAAQVHECVDGSGFPRGLSGNRVAPLARLAGLVDSYITLVSHGPGRPALIPHDAVALLLREGARGSFEAHLLRAFINQLSLFPIGSPVRLVSSDDAVVIRRNGMKYAHPIVLTGTDSIVSTDDARHSILSPITQSDRMRLIDPDLPLHCFER